MEAWMNLMKCSKIGSVVSMACLAAFAGPAVMAVAADSGKSVCAAPEYREFNYWAGDWDAFDMDDPGKPVARTRVNLILNGCVLLENYDGTNGLQGRSFTIYDASRKTWHQTWVTTKGQLLTIEGAIHAGEMTLTGVDRTASGEERRVRVAWKPVEGGVRETAVTSIDAGKTWTSWFDLVFRPHKP